MTSLSSQDLSAIVVALLFVLLITRRMLRAVRGAPLSLPRLFGVAGLYVVLFLLLTLEELLYLPYYLPVVDVAVLAAVAALVVPFVQRRVVVYRDPAAGWSYRLGAVIPALYVSLFAARLVIDVAVLGIDPFFTSPTTLELSSSTTALLATVDALYAASTGLLVARTVAIYRAYRAAEATPPRDTALP